MPGSRAEGYFVAVAVAFAAMGATAQTAVTTPPTAPTPAAQTPAAGSPTALGPALRGPVRLGPRREIKPAPKPEPVAATPARQPDRDRPVIVVEGLGSIDPDSTGTLDEDRGGLGLSMWEGTPRSVIERLLPQISGSIRSATMRDLARRLLLSIARMPKRGTEDDADASGGKSLIAARVERLQAMGAISAAGDLVRTAPTRDKDPDLLRLKTENMLLANNLGGACAEARRETGRLVEIYWQRVLVFCQALEGDVDGAALGADLLAEGGASNDPAFLALIDRLTGNKEVTVESLPSPAPLHLAMLRTARMQIPADALAADSPPVLRTIGISPNAELDVRLGAAERAAMVGAISPRRLTEIYLSVGFAVEDLNNALTIAETERTPRGRALLYQAASIQSVPTAKAAVLLKAFKLAREDGHYPLAVQVHQSQLTDIPVSSEMVWFAAEAARALYAIRRPIPARTWLALLRQSAQRDPEAKAAAGGLWAVARLAGDEEARADDREALDAWRRAQRAIAPDQATRRIGLAYSLFEALGDAVSEAAWRELAGDLERFTAELPAPALRRALKNAAAEGRRGETVLLALMMAGPEGLNKLSPGVLAEILASLRAVGLEDEARSLALELAVALGL